MDSYIRYLCFLLVSLLLVYGIGMLVQLIAGLSTSRPYTNMFARLLCGTIFLVMFVSIFKTSGHTIHLGILFVLTGMILRYFSMKKKHKRKIVERWPRLEEVISLVLITVFLFSFRFYLIYNPSGIFLLPNADTLFHANVSNFIWISGVESISLDYLNIFPKHSDPYHYFDLWLNAAAFRAFHLNALTCYTLLTVTLLLTISWCGFMAITERYRLVPVWTHLLALSFVFFSGVYLPFYQHLPFLRDVNVFTVNPFDYTKLTVVMIFMQASVLFYLSNRFTEGTWMLLLLPVVFISTSIGLYAAVFIYIAIRYFLDRDLKQLLPSAAMLVIMALFFFIFYKTDQAGQTIKIRDVQGGYASLFTFSYLKTCVNIIGLTLIQWGVIFLPVLMILFPGYSYVSKYINPLKNRMLLLALLIYFTSLLAWAVLHYMVDTVQLFSNISVVMSCILIYVVVGWMQLKANPLQRILLYVFFYGFFIWKIGYTFSHAKNTWPESSGYLAQTSDIIKRVNPVGVFLMGVSEYTSVFSKNPIFNIGGKYLAYSNSNAYTYSLSVYQTPVDALHPETDNQLIGRSVFYQFTERKKENGTFRSVEDAQIDFIYTYKIDYLIASKAAVPGSAILKLVNTVITDPNTGQRFYMLDRSSGLFRQKN